MSTLKTHNLQSPDAGSVNIAMTPNAGMVVTGISTFTGAIDANGDLDVDGHTELDNINISGVSTHVGLSQFQNTINLTHASAGQNYIYFNEDLQFAKNGTGTRLKIDSSGRLLVGTGSASNRFKNGNGNGATPKFQFETANVDEQNDLSLTFGRNNAFGAEIILAKHRAATVGGHTIVQSGDRLGGINFAGADGTHFHPAALIQGRVDGTPGTGDMPGRLEFLTTADNAATPTERMRIDKNGYVQKFYNPAFFAYGGTNGRTILPANSKVTFNGVNNSIQSVNFSGNSKNSGYSTSNSRFTAPVTGTYHFTVAIYFYGDNAGQICAIVPRVNGNEINNGSDVIFFFSHDHNNANNQDGLTQSGSLTLNLAANDYVEVWRRSGQTGDHYYYKGHSHFCGYLVG